MVSFLGSSVFCVKKLKGEDRSMEKAINFSNNEKSLIWKRFIEPANGTEEESEHFIEVCEQFGLNPLLGDIVFQRYETKRGPKTQFITTRDGLLRVSTRQPGYVGPPNANVVKEGDHFEFLPAEGTVKHKFGTKRGKILGAYAIMKHKKHNPVAVFVDFDEYFQANSGKLNSTYGNSNVWDQMPSAMIVKIAEVFVLRRQFPLGGLYTQEEVGLNEPLESIESQPKEELPQPAESNAKQSFEQVDEIKQEKNDVSTPFQEMIVKSYEVKKSTNNKVFGVLAVYEADSQNMQKVLVKQDKLIELLKQVSIGEKISLSIYKENDFHFLKDVDMQTIRDDKTVTNEFQQQSEHRVESDAVKEDHSTIVLIQKVEYGQKASGVFAKIAGTINDSPVMIIARGETAVKKAKTLQQGSKASLNLKKENGFLFLMDVITDGQKAG